MQASRLRFREVDASSEHAIYTKVGYATTLCSVAEGRKLYTFNYLQHLIIPAIRHQQIQFYFDSDNKPVAYVIWGFLSERTEQGLLQSQVPKLHVSDWNDGESLWILDLVAPLGHVAEVLGHMRDVLFRESSSVRYLKFKHGRVIAKELSRADSLSFFGRRAVSSFSSSQTLPGW